MAITAIADAKASTRFTESAALLKLSVFLLLLVIWQVFAVILAQPDFPTFTQTLSALYYHTMTGDLLVNVGITVTRVAISFVLAMLIGSIFGIAMGARAWFNQLSDSLLIILLNVPALVVIILSYIWIGLVEAAAITAVVINKIPTVAVMLREGARTTDPKLAQVAQVYNIPWWRFMRQIYLPQLYPFILAAARNGLSLIWKIVLVVELLGRSNGVGFALHSMFQFFDIAGILAYTMAFIGVVFIIEWLCFTPFDRRIQRGR
ncbi:MAG: ABC transporter permease subunit [Glaciecola sp.]|jgi:NitT/TauT family transport system permease protein|nr:ABC transporter permease subunit [Glaciecola sp.]MDG1814797.1 ABC transporter permease subunit [Glaciecola sp.]MDG2098942.1 ABC transporter permease subunit [Glaciecola sp.]